MSFVEIRGTWEQEPIDLNKAYISPSSPKLMEAVRKIPSTTGPRRRRTVDLRDRPERAFLTPRNPNHVVQYMKGAEMAEPSNRRRILQRQITKHTAISRLSHHPKLVVKFKVPRSESCLAPGTGVFYMPRRSISSEGYVTACTLEALSLLADVSSKVEHTHIQRSCNLNPKLSEIDPNKDESFNPTMPLQKKMESVLKNLNWIKEQLMISVQDSNKMSRLLATEHSYKVVRKLRSPRTSVQAFRCPTKLQKNISLSKCDDIRSRMLRSRANSAHTAHWPGPPGRLARTDTSGRTTAHKDEHGEDKLPQDKFKSIIDSVSLAAQGATTLERVSKSSSQISGMKKKSSRGIERAKRFTNRILQFVIGETTVPEKRIRQTLGNNPDTSKALRLTDNRVKALQWSFTLLLSDEPYKWSRLLRERKVMRLGSGGRGRAYEYVATDKGLHHIHGVKQPVSEVVELTPESVVSSCNPISGATIISSAAPKSDAQRLPTHDTTSPEALASDANPSRHYSGTPHCSLKWPLPQILNCVLSSQSLDLPSPGITEY